MKYSDSRCATLDITEQSVYSSSTQPPTYETHLTRDKFLSGLLCQTEDNSTHKITCIHTILMSNSLFAVILILGGNALI